MFSKQECGASLSQNCTYLQNPGFPAAYAETAACSYTIRRMKNGRKQKLINVISPLNIFPFIAFFLPPDICLLRLDFETLNLLGPVGNVIDTGPCRDSLKVTTVMPVIHHPRIV